MSDLNTILLPLTGWTLATILGNLQQPLLLGSRVWLGSRFCTLPCSICESYIYQLFSYSYAGIVRSKWAINSAFMVIYAFSATLIVWVLWAYKMSFGTYMLPFVGRPGPVVSMAEELGQSQLPSTNPVIFQNFPLSTMVYFQLVFAAITIIITAGSFLCRMNFTAWVVFVPLWITFSYAIGAYSLWGGGFLWQMGVIDYSGGYVIHISSGTAGFIGAYWIGPRLAADREDSRPNNVLSVLAGAGILWIGWNGFNGGDPYAASADAGVAVLNTNVCTAMSLLCWTVCDVIYFKKPSTIGAVQGMITGLVAITPCAGVVAGWAAIAIGFASGTIPWVSMNIMGKKVAYFRKVDDMLGVFHTHCVAGFVGGFSVGLFATLEGCVAFGANSVGGAIEGNGRQVWLQ
jgi:Amt family ammonium transporter